jgi:hypothetical protein
MCTVTFIPAGDRVFITSNRDEKHFRSAALPPGVYQHKTGKLLFPRDADAGGTWLALHENGNAVVFLNGAFQNHIPSPPYRKSRGLILLDVADSLSPYDSFDSLNLDNIEPFTAIIRQDENLYECRWDGKTKYSAQLDAGSSHIWSSATLYDDNVQAKRKKWFNDWLQQTPFPDLEDILAFHQFTGDGDAHNDLMMNRNGAVFTVSITGMELKGESGIMQYLDLKNKKNIRSGLSFSKATLPR